MKISKVLSFCYIWEQRLVGKKIAGFLNFPKYRKIVNINNLLSVFTCNVPYFWVSQNIFENGAVLCRVYFMSDYPTINHSYAWEWSVSFSFARHFPSLVIFIEKWVVFFIPRLQQWNYLVECNKSIFSIRFIILFVLG